MKAARLKLQNVLFRWRDEAGRQITVTFRYDAAGKPLSVSVKSLAGGLDFIDENSEGRWTPNQTDCKRLFDQAVRECAALQSVKG